MKYYCHICDRVDFYLHDREHFNWEEFVTQEKIDRAWERRIGWMKIITARGEKKK